MRSWMDRPLCQMYTLLHSQGILYMPGVLNPGASLIGGM
jgi:Leu/Phe-tRNA-protein transferase